MKVCTKARIRVPVKESGGNGEKDLKRVWWRMFQNWGSDSSDENTFGHKAINESTPRHTIVKPQTLEKWKYIHTKICTQMFITAS